MNIRRYTGRYLKVRRLQGVVRMAVLAKPINMAFIIAEDKAEEFKKLKRSEKLDDILRKAKMINIKKN